MLEIKKGPYLIIDGEKFELVELSTTDLDKIHDACESKKIDLESSQLTVKLLDSNMDPNMIRFDSVRINYKDSYYMIDGKLYIVKPESSDERG